MKIDQQQEIVKRFEKIEDRIRRAKLIYEVNLVTQETVEVSIYEVIKSINELTDMVREIDPDRFGIKTVNSIHTPSLSLSRLHVCGICGSSKCTSDHK